MDKIGLLKRIEDRAKELGLSARAISMAATGSPDTVRNWQRRRDRGEDFSMRQDNLEAVADALSVDLLWLTTGQYEVLGIPDAGMAEETAEYLPKAGQSEAVKAIYADTAKHAEVARRMTTSIPSLGLNSGDLVICDLGREPKHGEAVLVHVQDGKPHGTTLIRRWYSPWLLSGDPIIDSDPLRDTETGVTIRYPVIGTIRGT